MASEIELGYSWIYNTLVADTGILLPFIPGGVWYVYALPGTAPPYVTIKYQSGVDHVVFGGARAFSDMRFHVLATGPVKSLQTIWNAAARIDTLLTIASQLTVSDGTILASFRDQPVSTDEWVDGEKWQSTGGEYRVLAKAS